MGWFASKLGPGERVVLRGRLPAGMTWQPLPVLGAVMMFVWLWGELSHADPSDELAVTADAALIAMGLWLLMILFFRADLANWLITDRRIVVDRGVLRRRSETMGFDEIVDSEFDGGALVLHGRGESLRLYIGPVKLLLLQDALGQWGPPDGTPAGRLRDMLEPGETVLGQFPSKRLRIWGLFFFVSGVAFAAWAAGEFVLRGEAVTLHDALGLSWIGLIMLSNAAYIIVISRWRNAVTDRRIFTRRPYDYSWCDVLPLSQIDWVETAIARTLALQSNGRTVACIVNRPGTAERIRAAIESAKETA